MSLASSTGMFAGERIVIGAQLLNPYELGELAMKCQGKVQQGDLTSFFPRQVSNALKEYSGGCHFKSGGQPVGHADFRAGYSGNGNWSYSR